MPEVCDAGTTSPKLRVEMIARVLWLSEDRPLGGDMYQSSKLLLAVGITAP